MRLTDYVTAQMVEDWIKHEAEKVRDPFQSATKIFVHLTPELVKLSQTIEKWFGVNHREIGPLLQYLDEAIRFNSEDK